MRPLRYGVIGIHGVGRHHARWASLNPDVQLTGMADPDTSSIPQVAPNVSIYQDHRQLIDEVKLDAVSVCVPHDKLASVARSCLQQGIHVLVEKPLARRISEIDELIKASRQHACLLATCFQYRTYATALKLKEIVESGRLGTIRRVLWSWSSFRSKSYYERDDWRSTWARAGGGVLMNQVSHDLDLICWLFGRVASVSAQIGNQLQRTQLEDIISASIQFESGVLVTFQATINQPEAYSVRQIAGDRGMLVIQDVQSLERDKEDVVKIGRYSYPKHIAVQSSQHHFQSEIEWRTIKTIKCPWWTRVRGYTRLSKLGHKMIGKRYHPPMRGGHQVILNNFLAACRGQADVTVSAVSARRTVELINAIIYAAINRQTIELPLDPIAYDQLWEELSSGKRSVPHWLEKQM